MEMDSAYIKEQGLLELYVLDDLSEKEKEQVEAVLNQDPDLRALCNALEADLERMALENAILPPEAVKHSLMHAVTQASDSKVIPMKSERISRTPFYVAASVAAILLLGSIWMYSNWQSTVQELKDLQAQTEALQSDLENIENKLNDTARLYAAINDPDADKYVLRGNVKSPESVAIAYVNDSKKSVMLNASGLAKLESDKTYQVWADVDGEMINMGVVPKGTPMVELAYIDQAESLNITIEPKGGSEHPTVSQLITNVIL